MKYTEKIMQLVEEMATKQTENFEKENNLRHEYQNERITGVVYAERMAELKDQVNAELVKTAGEIEATRKAYAEAVKAGNIVDGSMLDKDAELLKLPIDLTSDQFNALVDRHRNNPLMCELLRDYQSKRSGKYDCYLPTPEQKISDFSKFCETASSVIKDPNSIQAGFFADGSYTPQSATEEI